MLLGVALALLTSIAWAFGNVFVQRSSRAVGAQRSLLWTLVLGAVLSGAVSPWLDSRTAAITPAAVAWLALAGFSSLLAYGGMFFAFARGQLSLTVPFVSCWSLVAGLIGLVLFDERPRSTQLLGAAVVFVGVMLVAVGASSAEIRRASTSEGPPGPRQLWTLLAAVGAGIGFGTMFPALARSAPAFGPFGAAALVYGIALALGLPLAGAFKLDLRWPPRSSWPLLLGTGFFETAGFVLLTVAGLVAPLSVVAPVASLAAVFTVVYAFLFMKERPGRRALAGSVLASIGVIVLAL